MTLKPVSPFQPHINNKLGIDLQSYYDIGTRTYRSGPTFGQTLKATIGYAYDPFYESAKLFFDEEAQQLDEGFNPRDMDNYESYSDFHDQLNYANNEYHYKKIIKNLDDNFERRRILMDSSLLSQFGAGFFDPINLIALPFGGPTVGIGRSALRVGAGTAALQAGAETLRHPFDPLSSPLEVALNISSAAVAGTILGTAISVPITRRSQAQKILSENIDSLKERFGYKEETFVSPWARDAKKAKNPVKETADDFNEIINDRPYIDDIAEEIAEYTPQKDNFLAQESVRLEKETKKMEREKNKAEMHRLAIKNAEGDVDAQFALLKDSDIDPPKRARISELNAEIKNMKASRAFKDAPDYGSNIPNFKKRVTELENEIKSLKKNEVDNKLKMYEALLDEKAVEEGSPEVITPYFEAQLKDLDARTRAVDHIVTERKKDLANGADLRLVTPKIGGKRLAQLTNFGPLKKILGNDNARLIKEYGLRLANDYGLFLESTQQGKVANYGDGESTGSVYLDSKSTYNGEVVNLYKSLSKLWTEDVEWRWGYNFTNAKRKAQNLLQMGDRQEVFEDFLNNIGVKYITGDQSLSPNEKEAVFLLKEFFEKWDGRLQETGILGSIHKMKVELAQLEKELNSPSRVPHERYIDKHNRRIPKKSQHDFFDTLIELRESVIRGGDYADDRIANADDVIPALEKTLRERGLTKKQQDYLNDLKEFVASGDGREMRHRRDYYNTKEFKDELQRLDEIILEFDLTDKGRLLASIHDNYMLIKQQKKRDRARGKPVRKSDKEIEYETYDLSKLRAVLKENNIPFKVQEAKPLKMPAFLSKPKIKINEKAIRDQFKKGTWKKSPFKGVSSIPQGIVESADDLVAFAKMYEMYAQKYTPESMGINVKAQARSKIDIQVKADYINSINEMVIKHIRKQRQAFRDANDTAPQMFAKLKKEQTRKRSAQKSIARYQPELLEKELEILTPFASRKLRGEFLSLARSLSRRRQKIDELRLGIEDAEAKLTSGSIDNIDELFFPRYWKKDYIRANREALAQVLREWILEPSIKLADDGSTEKIEYPNAQVWVEKEEIDPYSGYTETKWTKKELNTDSVEVDNRVNSIIDSILGENDVTDIDNTFVGVGKSKHLRHRKLEIPNRLVKDFIETDVGKVMFAYTNRVAPSYEFSKKFGMQSIDEVLDDIRLAGFEHGQSLESIQEAVMQFKHLYDRIVGRMQKNPDRLDNVIARWLRRAAETNFLGSAGLAAISEPAKILMEHETRVFFKSLFDSIDSNLKHISKKDLDLTGEASDTVLGSLHMRQVNEESSNPLNNGLWDKSRDVFYFMNGLGPITHTLKFWDSLARSHKIIDLSKQIAKKKKISKQDMQFMAQYGISDDMAKRIAKQPVEQSERGLWVGNTEQWGDEGATVAFRNAMSGGILNTILMGTPADKPILMDGVVYVRLETLKKAGVKAPKEDDTVKGYARIESGLLAMPLQFYSYAFAAVNKITLSYANGTAKNRALAASTAMILAYMSVKMKTPDWAWDEMSYSDRFARAFDQSGLAALYSDIYYTSMHTIDALGGPNIGLGIIGPKFRDTASEAVIGLGGAGPSIGFSYAQALHEMLIGDTGAGAKQLIRSLPYARVYWWKDSVNEMTNALDERID